MAKNATEGALMSVTPNFCCDETKNRGAYTRLTFLFAKFGNSRWGGFRQDDDGTSLALEEEHNLSP